ncbi:MAG: TlpA disulfide reductase family protein [Bacteroidota bacterium]
MFIAFHAGSQEIDSSWIAKNYVPRLAEGIGSYLSNTKFIDEKGKVKKLTDFKGKILFVDIWATDCAPCIAKFPHAEQLLKRLKAIGLDAAIQFVNICIEETKEEWKRLLKKHNPVGINLYSLDTAIDKAWNIDAVPRYMLVNVDGRILTKNFTGPDDGSTEYLLYAATKGIQPLEAIWIQFRQYKYYREHNYRFTDDLEGSAYAKWYSITEANRIEYFKWDTERRKKSSR